MGIWQGARDATRGVGHLGEGCGVCGVGLFFSCSRRRKESSAWEAWEARGR